MGIVPGAIFFRNFIQIRDNSSLGDFQSLIGIFYQQVLKGLK
jgi:hypothetical protein